MAKLIPFRAAPEDAAARADALDIQRSFIVEAPAGSGKTGLLVQRFLKLLTDHELARPEEVLAMTFTRKATAEMQQRVLSELQAAHERTALRDEDDFHRKTRVLAEAVLARSQALGWDLLAQPQRLNIRSILSVCMELSRSQPLLSGAALLQPLDDPAALYREAARRAFLALGGSDAALSAALHTLLVHRNGSLGNCIALAASMLATREKWGELIPLGSAFDDALLDTEVRPRLEATLEVIVCAGLSRALALVPPPLLQDVVAIAAAIGSAPQYKDKPPALSLCADKHLPPEAIAEDLDHWRALIEMLLTKEDNWRAVPNRSHLGHDFETGDATRLKRLVTDLKDHPLSDDILSSLAAARALPPARYPDEQWAVARALFLVLRRALVELKLLFAERGECDFPELALGARAALSASDAAPDLALAAGSRLRHLLVDEMQDTSTAQYELIEQLTRSWDGHSQTLFLVGDPKQSIYLFRQARVERFLRTLRDARIGDLELTPVALTANFRSQQTLVEEFNSAFEPIFVAGDVPFVAATATRDPTDTEGIVWHATISGDDTGADTAEARALVGVIAKRLNTSLPTGRSNPWSIAVLARSRSHLLAVVAELKRAKIAFRAVDLDPLDERPEVLDALALTRALLHPADRTAWLAVLRAPWCGLTLADLLTLTGEGEPATSTMTVAQLAAARRHLLSPAGQLLLDRTWPVLQAALTTLGRTALAVHVERTWLSLGGDAPLTPAERSNVQRFLTLLRESESNAFDFDLTAISSRLKTLFAEPLSGPHIHVDLQTIHSAKGLEWDLVLVPGLHRRPGGSSAPLLNWLELDGLTAGPDATLLLAPIWGRGQDSDRLNDWLRSVRSQRELAETKRLFYVASTRAKEQLHLFAALPVNTNGELSRPVVTTLLSACWPAAEQSFIDALSSPTQAQHVAAKRPLHWPSANLEDEPLALAAAAGPATLHLPTIQRLPLNFSPAARFTAAAAQKLPYAAAPQTAALFDRPEGSFAVRAFGNVVHRYLQLLADRLLSTAAPSLLAELPGWKPRLEAALRGEGLPPRDAARESVRALDALGRALADPIGFWLLSPHPSAASESALNTDSAGLRVDRTFIAGPTPLATTPDTIWIVDFKTTAQGSLPDAVFADRQRALYSAQLETYAALRRKLPDGHLPIQLGLYYPAIPRLLHWPALPMER